MSRNSPQDLPSQHALPAQFLHDLRTPLNQIIGYSEMLAEQAQEEGQTALVPDLKKIQSAGRQLLAVLNNGAFTMPGELPVDSTPGAPPHVALVASGEIIAGVPENVGPARILVVDDIAMNRDVLSRRLQNEGHHVEMAENGRMALESLASQPIDLILLDIMMPEMDGYEVLQLLKSNESLSHIPVIMISALDEMDSAVRCIEMGAEDYLPKPFNPTLLKARIGACLEKKRAHDRETALYAQLQENYKSLQELEKLRDGLTNMIVHDLRTPLTAVISGMQTVQILGDLNSDQQEMMTLAEQGGKTLLHMIGDLLDVEKLESGAIQLDYSVVVAVDLVATATAQVASLIDLKNQTLTCQVASDVPPFRADADKLTRILVNLLGNAIKFTPVGGHLTLAVHVGGTERVAEQSLVFSVSDTGEGIHPDAFERVFEKFGQVSPQHGGRLGTGLGLTFCKLAAEAHGGQMGLVSVLGAGSTFTCTIPLGWAQADT